MNIFNALFLYARNFLFCFCVFITGKQISYLFKKNLHEIRSYYILFLNLHGSNNYIYMFLHLCVYTIPDHKLEKVIEI